MHDLHMCDGEGGLETLLFLDKKTVEWLGSKSGGKLEYLFIEFWAGSAQNVKIVLD